MEFSSCLIKTSFLLEEVFFCSGDIPADWITSGISVHQFLLLLQVSMSNSRQKTFPGTEEMNRNDAWYCKMPGLFQNSYQENHSNHATQHVYYINCNLRYFHSGIETIFSISVKLRCVCRTSSPIQRNGRVQILYVQQVNYLIDENAAARKGATIPSGST